MAFHVPRPIPVPPCPTCGAEVTGVRREEPPTRPPFPFSTLIEEDIDRVSRLPMLQPCGHVVAGWTADDEGIPVEWKI